MPKSSIGQVARNTDGQIYITQKVMGVDPKEISDAVREGEKAKALPIKDNIDKVTQQIAALQEAKGKLTDIQATTSLLANRLHIFESEKIQNIYNAKQLDINTNDGSDYTAIAQITPLETANLGNFTLSVTQTAKTDLLKSTLSIDGPLSPLGAEGTLSLGTTFPNCVDTFTITADMSLTAIQKAINLKTEQTHVYAEVAFVSPGLYELKLKSNALSASIVLNDQGTGVEVALGLTRPPSSNLAASLQANTQDIPLNQQGSLIIGLGNGSGGGVNTQTLNITQDMSLKDIVRAINTATGTTTVTADYDLTYDTPQIADSNGDMPNRIYQLRLKAQSSSDTVYVAGGPDLLGFLGLSTPVTDYNSLASLFTCDGTNFKRNDNTITDVISGVTIDLKGASSTTVLTASTVSDKTMILQTLEKFMTSYNDLKTFYDDQIAMDTSNPNKPVPAKTAVLLNNQAFKQAYTSLSTILASTIPGLDGLNNMTDLGLGIDPATGKIQLKNLSKFTDMLDKNYTKFIGLLGNQSTTTNTDFKVGNITALLGESLSNVPITVTYARDGEGRENASFTINGTVIPATVKGSLITGAKNEAFPGLEGLRILYVPTLENDQSASTTLFLTQGLCARLDCAITQIIVDKPPLKEKEDPIKGSLICEIDNLNAKERNDQKKITVIDNQAEKLATRMYNEMQKASKAQQQYEQIHSMVKSFQNAGRS